MAPTMKFTSNLTAYGRLIAVLILFMVICDSQWISSSTPTLPANNSRMAIGSHSGSIFILGGIPAVGLDHQMIVYQIDGDVISDVYVYATEYLPDSIWGYGQFYVQIGYYSLYMIHSDRLYLYNMETKLWSNITTIPVDVGYWGCLAASNTHLIITGGSDPPSNRVQTLELNTFEWVNIIPSMHTNRRSHSCIVAPNTNVLYVIGGKHYYNSYLKSIEKIDLNSASPEWNYIGNLTVVSTATRAVYEMNMIFIIGGLYANGSGINIVHTIDTINNLVSLSSQVLPYGVGSTAAIIVDRIIYCFGGDSVPGKYIVTMMKYMIPTMSPTQLPTMDPTTAADTNWIHKDDENCGDGFTDVDNSSIWYDKYCMRCPSNTAGTYGICEECMFLKEPNGTRTECQYFQPWWLWLLETLGALTFICVCICSCIKNASKISSKFSSHDQYNLL